MTKVSKSVIFICLLFVTAGFIKINFRVSASFYDIPEISYGNSIIYSQIVFTGFDQNILSNIVPLSPFSQSILPQYVSNVFSQSYTSKSFYIHHSYQISPDSFDSLLFEYLNGSAKSETVNLTDGSQVTGKFINANDTLNWIGDRYETYFGPIPIPGYSLIIANNSGLDDAINQNHWYNQSWGDPDTGTILESQFMTGFGAQKRFYYLDLSSDSYLLHEAEENATIQEIEYLYNLNTEYGLKKLAEYLAEWIYEIERNLFISDFQFQPLIPMGNIQTGTQFVLETLVYCNITNFEPSTLNWTINEDYILENLRKVYPWLEMKSSLRFISLSDEETLDEIIHNSMVPWGVYSEESAHKYAIDLNEIYEELYTGSDFYMEEEVSSLFYTVHLQTFAFLFDDALFGIPQKGRVEPLIHGVALKDSANRPLNIISQSFQDLFGDNRSNPINTIGLSRLILQQIGKQMGLFPPFHFGVVGNFVDDVLASYPHSSKFSKFSVDNLRRAQIDYLAKSGVFRYQIAAQNVETKVYDKNLLNYFYQLSNMYNEIYLEYDQMNYSRAYTRAKSFYIEMLNFDPTLGAYDNSRDRTEITPVFFSLMLIFLIIAVYYRGKFQVFKRMHPKRELLTPDLVIKFEEKARERFIASRQAAREKFTETQEKIHEDQPHQETENS